MAQEDTPTLSFPQMEESTLHFWKENQTFEKSLEKNKKAFSFYDGPPFATGLPHYGHLLASTLKDIVPRYWTMKGFRVPRRWGWDCHGLPIEQEIDKKHQFKSTEEIEKFGIAAYNEECRSIVLRFTEEWKNVISRLGRWVDFENDYKTMDRDFMESVWWVFAELWKKGLIYRGYKVMAFSTSLGTPLSNFEASSNYQEVQDPAITVSFPLIDDPNTHFLAWTTTPWTLPSNLALAVGPDITYVKVKDASKQSFILAENLIENYFKKDSFEIEKTFSGRELLGLRYQPLFDFYKDRSDAFKVIASDHVTTESGTGIVHMAPAFGEDDFIACQKENIKPVCPVNNHGEFTNEISNYAGQYVKEADKNIIRDLKQSQRLFKQDTLQHSYPFCPRTDTPLIYKAVSSWFVSVEKIKESLIKNNKTQTHWVPSHLREGRFGKWLENARDWAISRNRYWGNPLPIFESFEDPEDSREYFVVGSAEELEKLSGRKLPDLHRHHLDDIIIEKNSKKFRRVPEVLDCWFESGSMPYAQYHYPFENREAFKNEFPADFIGEGLDQTRGWFYTLSVLGTILFDQIPFKNVVVNGLILAEDGKKMSKRLKNYPDPMKVMNQHGADALRLYLIDSPVIRAEELRFSESGVKEIVRKVLLKLWNSYSFFESYAKIDQYEFRKESEAPSSENILDRWIISRFQSLLQNIEREMKAYHLFNVVPEILRFIEELTNTYIRLNRSRFWEDVNSQSKASAFDTLHYVLLNFCKVFAPFAPFLSETIFQKLRTSDQAPSVHLEDYPIADVQCINQKLESGVALLEEVILLARNIREKNKIKNKIPLNELRIIHRKEDVLKSIQPLETYLLSELNVKKITYAREEKDYVQVQIKANGATLGPKVGGQMKQLMKQVAELGLDELSQLDEGQSINLSGFEIRSEDVKVSRTPVEGDFPVQASAKIIVALDTSVSRDQELEGLSREIVNRIQKHRKDSRLQLDDRINLHMSVQDHSLQEAIKIHEEYIKSQTLALELKVDSSELSHESQEYEIDGQNLRISLEVVAR